MRRMRRINFIARRILPASLRRWLGARLSINYLPPVGKLSFGSLRRVAPISRSFGYDAEYPLIVIISRVSWPDTTLILEAACWRSGITLILYGLEPTASRSLTYFT
jgi:hypothetical protein